MLCTSSGTPQGTRDLGVRRTVGRYSDSRLGNRPWITLDGPVIVRNLGRDRARGLLVQLDAPFAAKLRMAAPNTFTSCAAARLAVATTTARVLNRPIRLVRADPPPKTSHTTTATGTTTITRLQGPATG
jgi:hypothetical protein